MPSLAAACGVAPEDDDGNGAVSTLSDNDLAWIDAVKKDPTALDQITDTAYKAKIKKAAGL